MGDNRAVLARTVRHALVLLHLREVTLLALEVRVCRRQLRAAATIPDLVMVVPLLMLLVMLLVMQLLLLVTGGGLVVVPGTGGRGGHGRRRRRRRQRGCRRRRRLSLTGDTAVHDDHECGQGREGPLRQFDDNGLVIFPRRRSSRRGRPRWVSWMRAMIKMPIWTLSTR